MEDLVEAFTQILLVSTVEDLPVLPEHFAEDLLRDVLVLVVMLWVQPDNLCQRPHQSVQLAALVLLILLDERVERLLDLCALSCLIEGVESFNDNLLVGQWAQVG